MSDETEWRAEPQNDGSWSVVQYSPFDVACFVLAENLGEPAARLIAAAPDMLAFIKEEIEDSDDPFFSERAESILRKAGAIK